MRYFTQDSCNEKPRLHIACNSENLTTDKDGYSYTNDSDVGSIIGSDYDEEDTPLSSTLLFSKPKENYQTQRAVGKNHHTNESSFGEIEDWHSDNNIDGRTGSFESDNPTIVQKCCFETAVLFKYTYKEACEVTESVPSTKLKFIICKSKTPDQLPNSQVQSPPPFHLKKELGQVPKGKVRTHKPPIQTMSSSNRFASLDYGSDEAFLNLVPYLEIEGLRNFLLDFKKCLIDNSTAETRIRAIKDVIVPCDFVSAAMSRNERVYPLIRSALISYGIDCKINIPNATSVWKKLVAVIWPDRIEEISKMKIMNMDSSGC